MPVAIEPRGETRLRYFFEARAVTARRYPNLDQFDRRSRTSVQLVTISVPEAGGAGDKILGDLAHAAVAALNLHSIQQQSLG